MGPPLNYIFEYYCIFKFPTECLPNGGRKPRGITANYDFSMLGLASLLFQILMGLASFEKWNRVSKENFISIWVNISNICI